MRLLLQSSGSTELSIDILIQNEEFIFTDFLRHIEGNEPFLSVTFFTFLSLCASFIPKWLLKIKRVLIDTQFSALLAHVLRSSLNRCAISSALKALEFYVNDCEFTQEPRNHFFFESAVSGFLLINQNAKSSNTSSVLDSEQDRHEHQIAIYNLETEKSKLEKSNERLLLDLEKERSQSRIESESSIKLEEGLQKSQSENEELQRKVTNLTSRYSKKKGQLEKAVGTLDDLKRKNEDLVERLTLLEGTERENAQLREERTALQRKISELEEDFTRCKRKYARVRAIANDLKQELQERKNACVALEQSCNEAQQRSANLFQTVEHIKSEKDALKRRNEKLEVVVSKAEERETQLGQQISRLEASSFHLQQEVRISGDVEQKYKKKKKEWKERVASSEMEKRKWESIAKFVHRVAQVKGGAITDVYGQIGLENT
jgi:predicted  nucleic acid-binding Zn-ribbon protein